MNLTPQGDIDYEKMHITDFGIAYTTQLANRTGGYTQVRGCLEYLAPEIRHLQTEHSTAMSDMWTVGVIGYEICLGQDLNSVSQSFQEIKNYINGQPLNLWRIPSRFSSSVHQIIQTCMAMEPLHRFTADGLRQFIVGHLTILGAGGNNVAENSTFMTNQWRFA